MKSLRQITRQLAVATVLLVAAQNQAFAGELPIVPNVQLVGNKLTWDPLEGATGYNIYNRGYLDTVIDAFEYTVTEVGQYSVLAFNDQGDFTPRRGSRFLEFTDGVDNRPLVFFVSENFFYQTRRCDDVSAGDSCVASCPDSVGSTNPNELILVRGATGGACSSSDNLAVNAFITPDDYTCTVSNFTTRVTAQVVCAIEVLPRN